MRKKFIFKIIAVYTALNLLAQIFMPTISWALTGGPSQPEFDSFEPAGASQMVDLFTGDFTYNIPLLDVDGYPVNISYHAGTTMDQEASWVGLGWNINAGAINRGVRGLPDDFSGDVVKREINMKPQETWGAMIGGGVELVGKDGAGFSLSGGLGVVHNNYKGWGFEFAFDPTLTFNIAKGIKGYTGLGMKASTQEGIDVFPRIGIGAQTNGGTYAAAGVGVGVPINSRDGLKSIVVSASIGVEHKGSGGGISNTASVPIGSQTYIPNLYVGKTASAFSGDFKLGGEVCFAVNPFGYLKGYYLKQQINDNERTKLLNGYGYLYSQTSANASSALQDFNREKDGIFHSETPNLPLPNYTYDIFSASGQGIGMSFRAHRSDVGVVYDNIVHDHTFGLGVSAEAGLGGLFKLGVNVNTVWSNGSSGVWDDSDGNDPFSNLKFQTSNSSDPELYEPSYFKATGEKTAKDELPVGDDKAVRLNLYHVGTNNAHVSTSFSDGTPVNSIVQRSTRDKRDQNISYLTDAEAGKIGLETNIKSYTENTFTLNNVGDENGAQTFSRGTSQHLSEMTVVRDDGSRYVYGIPVYNNKQREVTFNVGQNPTVNCTPGSANGLVNYTPCSGTPTCSGGDNSLDNLQGIDHYFESRELPAYAHSYLLTAFLSADYMDVTGDGPTSDDLGTYTKFNYTKDPNEYHWRVPFDVNKANYDEGFKSDKEDDKGNYIYGEKDLWYLHSIETKNYIAEFTLNDISHSGHQIPRKDAYGVYDINGNHENGGTIFPVNNQSRRLDKVTLYEKRDLLVNGANATPIKTVNFEYNYSLCQGIPNNSAVPEIVNVPGGNPLNVNYGGKLTLRRIFFTYGKSQKGRLSPYVFRYADPTHNLQMNPSYSACTPTPNTNPYNPCYDMKAVDRWSNYKPNNSTGCAITDNLTNPEYPYVNQDSTNANQYVSAWNLSTIETPSGGIIKVDYESDDYAYVQDVRATQMYKILGFTNNSANPFSSSVDALYNPLAFSQNNDYIFVDLRDLRGGIPNSVSNVDTYFKNEYLGGLSQLYFKCLVNITDQPTDYDYVSGYADIDIANCKVDPGSLVGNKYTRGIIKIRDVSINDKESDLQNVSPISKAAWQMGRMYLSRKIFPGQDPTISGLQNMVQGLTTLLSDAAALELGMNRVLWLKNFGQKVQLQATPSGECKNWVRLNNAYKKKLGGGHRVSKIVMSDSWNNMVSSELPFEYGQVYDYTKVENGKTISSGVASYEPLLGGDENPLRQPIPFSVKHYFSPNDDYFQEEPMGETFFPNPVVGYSKVTVKNLPRYINNNPANGLLVQQNATGKTEYEFYTSKDYPIITDRTGMDKIRCKPKLLSRLLKMGVKDRMFVSQGYLIKLNDMHGKPKSQKIFAEGQTSPISGITYFYKTKVGLKNKPELDNDNIPVMNEQNVIYPKTIGRDIDLVADARAQNNNTFGLQIAANLDFTECFFPLPVISIWPSFSSEKTAYKSMVTTKVEQKYGIMDKVVAFDNNSIVTTQNTLFDEETGNVLLTKTNNEFDDPIYNFTYPAHWTYDQMGSAYKNLGVVLKNDANGNAIDPLTAKFNITPLIVPGDEIEVTTLSFSPFISNIEPDRYWVSKDEVSLSNDLYLIDRQGNKATSFSSLSGTQIRLFKVIRSGRRNQQNTPVGSVATLNNPAISGTSIDFTNSKIVKSSSLECSNLRKLLCTTEVSNSGTNCNENTSTESDLMGLLSALAHDNVLVSPYPPGAPLNIPPFSAYANNLFQPVSPLWAGYNVWSATTTDNSLQGSVGCHLIESGECSGCQITLTCNPPCVGPVPWNSIASFSGLQYDPAFSTTTGSNHHFTVTVNLTGGGSILLNGEASCLSFQDCFTYGGTNQVCADEGSVINPYIAGIRGNWNTKTTYDFLDQRTRSAVPDIRDDGIYSSFKPFWLYSSAKWLPIYNPARPDFVVATPNDKWLATNNISKISSFGNMVESKDILDRYSASLFGYNHTLNTAVASNTTYRQIAFDGFEDYDFINDPCDNTHFSFYQYKANVTKAQAHTGRYSIVVNAGNTLKTKRDVKDQSCTPALAPDDVPYHLKCNDCLGTFSPYSAYMINGLPADQNYVISIWAKEKNAAPPVLDYPGAGISIKVNNTSLVLTNAKRGNIIDGWQKLEYEFIVPAGTVPGSIEVGLVNASTHDVYFDDIRIHPFNSSMQSFVYDPLSLRLWAELDDRNFATFYEYDEEGILVRVKKETEKGIYTIREVRTSPVKRDVNGLQQSY